jgi:hypothetical protein
MKRVHLVRVSGTRGLTAETIVYGPIAVPQRITSVTGTPAPNTARSGPAQSGAAVDHFRLCHQRRLNLSSSTKKSATTSRPDGTRTRTISLTAQVASGKWRSAVLQRTAEKVAGGKGRCWASARTNAARGSRPASAWVCCSIAGEVSTLTASSTVAAAARTRPRWHNQHPATDHRGPGAAGRPPGPASPTGAETAPRRPRSAVPTARTDPGAGLEGKHLVHRAMPPWPTATDCRSDFPPDFPALRGGVYPGAPEVTHAESRCAQPAPAHATSRGGR